MSDERHEPFTVVTLRDVYSLLVQVRDIVLAEQERRRGLALQVRALWIVDLMVVAAIVTAVVQSFGT